MPDRQTKAELVLRRRPSLSEAMPDFNAAMVVQLMAVPGFWNPEKSAADAPFYSGEGASLDLRKPLCAGLQGQIFYAARDAEDLRQDKAMYDDFIRVFIADQVDYQRFCFDVVPRLITAFGAYRGRMILNGAVSRADHDAKRARHAETDRDIDGRDSVYRLWPVSYADDLLCRRAFGLTAAGVVRRAAPACERAELLGDGAFLIVTTEIVTDADALDEIDARLKNLLRPDARTQTPGTDFVKFHGYQISPDGTVEMIERKLGVGSADGAFIFPHLFPKLLRQSEALAQNPGYVGVIEVPTEEVASQVRELITGLKIGNFTVRVVPLR